MPGRRHRGGGRLLPSGGTHFNLSGAHFQEPNKGTPLMAAAHFGHTDIVRMLLERAPNTAVDYATANGWTALIVAAMYHHADILVLLAGAGANVNYQQGGPGFTTLRLPVQETPRAATPRDPDPDGARHIAAVRALLQLGAGSLPPPPLPLPPLNPICTNLPHFEKVRVATHRPI